MPEKKTINRLLVFALGAAAAFLALEAGLTACGRLISRGREGRDMAACGPGTVRILCIGDSFTFGLGAPKGEDYPAQLERLLKKTFPDKDFRVANRGVCAKNTAMILEDLAGLLDATRPDIVTLMVGDPNFWDLRGMKREQGLTARLRGFLSGLHSVKLFRLLARNIKEKFASAPPTLSPPEAVSRILVRLGALSLSCRHWKMAECSLSTGSSFTPCFATACVTR